MSAPAKLKRPPAADPPSADPPAAGRKASGPPGPGSSPCLPGAGGAACQQESSHDILALDITGMPVRWIDFETAAGYYATGKVGWELGDQKTTLHGGVNRLTGLRSEIVLSTIIAIEGPRWCRRDSGDRVPLSRAMLFTRDRHICAYCGGRFGPSQLEIEHVTPRSLGGTTIWQNLVSACRACNQRKGNRTPEQAGMPLLFVPYVPNRHEAFILSNRRILADQMSFLLAGVPRHSRLWAARSAGVTAGAVA